MKSTFILLFASTFFSTLHANNQKYSYEQYQGKPFANAAGKTFTRDPYKEPCFNVSRTPYLNVSALSNPLIFYVAGASMYHLLTFSELFLNKENISFQELQQLRPIFLLEPTGYQVLAYSKAYQATCNGTALADNYEFDCVANPKETNVNENIDISKFKRMKHTIIATDNKSWILGGGCVDGVSDYHIVATDPCPDVQLIAEAVANITQFGFNPEFFTVVDFCKKAVYGPSII